MAILDNLNSMKNALSVAHQILFKYYSFMDDFYFYMMSVIFDPRFKKTYLEHKEFKSLCPRLISATITLLKKLVNKIKMYCGADEINSCLSHENQKPNVFFCMFAHCNADNEMEDEVKIYLFLRCEDSTIDPLEYQKAHEKQCYLVSAIAKDVLSISDSLVPVEQNFHCVLK